MRRKGLMAAVLIAGGVGAIGYGLFDAIQAIRSASWPTVSGTVISSEVATGSSGTGMRRGRTFTPTVRYDYAVDNQHHTGTRISFRDGIGLTRADAEAVVARYVPGASVRVAHDPADPARSVLEVSAGPETFATPGFGLLLAGAGAFVLLRRSKPNPVG